jgi:hypothetical protein
LLRYGMMGWWMGERIKGAARTRDNSVVWESTRFGESLKGEMKKGLSLTSATGMALV